MTNKFSFYDFVAHFIPGLLLIGAVTVVFLTPANVSQLLRDAEAYKYVFSVVMVLLSYGLGHVISQLAGVLIEGVLVRRLIGYQSEHLFADGTKARWLFRDYKRSYSEDFRTRFLDIYEKTFETGFAHDDTFMNCFHYVKEKSERTLTRLNTFIAVYDFSRNMAMALLILSLSTLTKGMMSCNRFLLCGSPALLVLGFLFLYRYLKYFRHYADEVFRSFVTLRQIESRETSKV